MGYGMVSRLLLFHDSKLITLNVEALMNPLKGFNHFQHLQATLIVI